MTNLSIYSDTHNEFSKYKAQVKDAGVIVLAGDIDIGTRGLDYAKELLHETSSKIVYVPGNHEFYGSNIDDMRKKLRQEYANYILNEQVEGEPQRLFYLDGDEAVIDGVRFLGCTLWTNFELFGESKRLECLAEARWLNDFRLIKIGNGDVFRPRDSADLFEQSVKWLTRKLDEPFDGKTVVITHHLPSADSVAERYKTDLLSACFASNLDYLFGKCDIWIHGHTHDSFDYTKNGTRVVCNPRGYSRFGKDVENFNFDPKLVVEL